jgi:hypothetical protein
MNRIYMVLSDDKEKDGELERDMRIIVPTYIDIVKGHLNKDKFRSLDDDHNIQVALAFNAVSKPFYFSSEILDKKIFFLINERDPTILMNMINQIEETGEIGYNRKDLENYVLNLPIVY